MCDYDCEWWSESNQISLEDFLFLRADVNRGITGYVFALSVLPILVNAIFQEYLDGNFFLI